MQKIFVMFGALGLLMAVAVSCNKDSKYDAAYYSDKATCTTDTISYNGTVKAILNGSCAYSGCHSTKSKAEGVILDTYSSAKSEFSSGEALCTIYQDCTPMPQGAGKLSDDVIQKLTCWAKNGYKE
jgi:hypothetical protein